jgi:hypothetical protein
MPAFRRLELPATRYGEALLVEPAFQKGVEHRIDRSADPRDNLDAFGPQGYLPGPGDSAADENLHAKVDKLLGAVVGTDLVVDLAGELAILGLNDPQLFGAVFDLFRDLPLFEVRTMADVDEDSIPGIAGAKARSTRNKPYCESQTLYRAHVLTLPFGLISGG